MGRGGTEPRGREQWFGNQPLRDLTPFQKAVLGALCIMNFSLFTLLPLIAPLYPTMAAERGVSPLEMGFVMGSSWIVMCVAAPIFGAHITWFGARLLALLGVCLAGMASICCGALAYIEDHVTFLGLSLAARVIEGLGVSAFIVSSQTIAAGLLSESIQTVIGVFLTIQGIAAIISPLLAGFLYAAGGFFVPFVAMGTLALLCAPIAWYILRHFKEPKRQERGSLVPLLTDVRSVCIAVHVTVLTTTYKFIEYYSALYVKQTFKYGPEIMGVILSVACISFAVTAIIWVKAAKFMGARPVMFIASFGASASCLFLGPVPFLNMYPNTWLYFVMTSTFGVSLSGGLVTVVPELLRIARDKAMPDNFSTYGIVSACYNSAYDVGCFIGPLIGGPLYSYAGFEWSAAVFAVLLFLTGSMLITQHAYDKHYSTPREERASLLHEEMRQNVADAAGRTSLIQREPGKDS